MYDDERFQMNKSFYSSMEIRREIINVKLKSGELFERVRINALYEHPRGISLRFVDQKKDIIVTLDAIAYIEEPNVE